MNILTKYLPIISSQIKRSDVKIPAICADPNKITDDNQSLKNGVINEESDANLRSPGATGTRRRRSTKS